MNARTTFIADYNPEALATIKAMAGTHIDSDIAATLGWEVGTLRERARKHQIELLGRKPTNTSWEMNDKPSLTARQSGVIEKRTKPPEPQYEPPSSTGDDALDHIIETLSPSLAETACVLAKVQSPISAESLASRFCMSELGARTRVRKLARQLRQRDTPYRIEGSKGRGGGYRLVRVSP